MTQEHEKDSAKFKAAVAQIEEAVNCLHRVMDQMGNKGLRFKLADYNEAQAFMKTIYTAIGMMTPEAREEVLPHYAGLSARLPLYSPHRTTN